MTRCRPSSAANYVSRKRKAGESVTLKELPHADHFDLITPASQAFGQVKSTVMAALG
ncbi:MAG: hypothetical protein ACLPHI_03190 [Terriglobales bacterium]